MNFNPQNIFKRQPMAFITIAFIIGILLNKYIHLTNTSVITAIIFIIFFTILRNWKYSYLLLLITITYFGLSITNYHGILFNMSLDNVQSLADQQVEFSGIIVEENNYSSGQRFIVKNVQLYSDSLNVNDKVKYIVYPNDENITKTSIGDTLGGSGKLQLFKEIRNPGEYNYKRYYHNNRIVGRIYSNSSIEVKFNHNWVLKKSVDNFRESVREKLIAYSDDDTSTLLSALILGDRTNLDQDIRESFVNVGVIHVLAVSGLHVGYVLVILLLIVKIIRVKWGWDKLIVVFGLILFTILSGGRPSVVRATIMASLYIFAPVLNRRPNAWNIIATAAFIILIVDPNSLFNIGFQLSFAAVISIVYFYSLLIKILPDHLSPNKIKNNLLRFFWALLLVSFSAQLGTIPVVAYYFGRIPLIAIIANLFVIPLIGGFVALGLTKLFFFWITPFSFFIDQVLWLTKNAIYGIVSIFDKFPLASIQIQQFNWINLIQYIIVIIIFFVLFQRKFSKIIIIGMLLINLLIWPSVLKKNGMDIIFLDLGKNEATLIKNEEDKSILINAGIISQFSDDLNRKILPTLNKLAIDKIDWLINSQGNSFHDIAIAKTLETIEVDTVWDVGLDSNSSIDAYIKSLIQLKNIDNRKLNRGAIIKIDEHSYIQCLLPIPKQDIEKSTLAIKIISGSNSILFVNKLSQNDIKILIGDINVIKSDVLKMSYPKQIPKNMNEFIQYVNPKMTIITSKRTGKYSPTVDELDKLFESDLFFTDSIGAVWLLSDGKNPIKVKNWK